MTTKPLYKQTAFGKHSNDELLALIEADEAGKEWLDMFARQITDKMGLKNFGLESAKELIVAAIASGHYVPKFAR